MKKKQNLRIKKVRQMVEESPELADKVMDMSDRDFEDETDATGFEGLTEEEKVERTKWLWFMLMLKVKGSAKVLHAFNTLNKRILEYGTKRGIIIKKEQEFKPLWFIIDTNCIFKKIWNIVVIILLMYTATYAPYRTAFIDNVSTPVFIFESFIDALFLMDFIINLI